MNILAIITKALEVAEERLKKNLGQQELHYKESSKDFATNTDLSIESSMSEYLKEVTPDIPIIGEEFSPIAPDNITNQSYWVIDPIDGTANFSRQIPLYGICLALMESGSAVACGIVFSGIK